MKQQLIFLIIVLIALTGCQKTNGQIQLVLLKHEKVLIRLNPGDDFIYKLNNSKVIKQSYINNLSDTAVTAHNDVVAFHTIDKIYFSRSTFSNRVGSVLTMGGLLLFLIDQINVVLVNGNKPRLNGGVSKTSLAFAGIGLPMMLIRKKSQRLNYKYKLLMVKKGSVFYHGELNNSMSPY